jgi:ketosteroid isomerase-like protein
MPDESTTPDPVERWRRHLEALNRRDFDAVMSFYALDAVYVGTELGMFEGTAAIRDLFEDITSPYDDFHYELEEIIDLGNGVAFSITIFTGHPVGSSGEVRNRVASVVISNEGVIERMTNYVDLHEARAAAEQLAGERDRRCRRRGHDDRSVITRDECNGQGRAAPGTHSCARTGLDSRFGSGESKHVTRRRSLLLSRTWRSCGVCIEPGNGMALVSCHS